MPAFIIGYDMLARHLPLLTFLLTLMPLSVCACAAAAAGAAGGAISLTVWTKPPESLDLLMAEMTNAVDKIRSGRQESQGHKFFRV
jgi:hypothetical protein